MAHALGSERLFSPHPHVEPLRIPLPAPILGDNLYWPTNWPLTSPPIINAILGEMYLHSHRISLEVRRPFPFLTLSLSPLLL